MGDLISPDEARRSILAAVVELETEEVALAAGLGRVLAETVQSPLDVPPFDSSATAARIERRASSGEMRSPTWPSSQPCRAHC